MSKINLIDNIKSYLTMLREMTYVNRYEWHVALRKRGKTLYEKNGSGFVTVPNNWRYWRADPFLFRHDCREYLFVEMYDRWQEKGVIGVARIRGEKCGRFRVCLELPWHLSYPCVFEDESGIHLVPESSSSGELWMYRCRQFPMKWEKERCIAKETVADATPLATEQGRFWFATKSTSKGMLDNDNLAVCQEGKLPGDFEYVIREDTAARPAGHFIQTESGLLRPSQNCTDTYGGNLEFRRVEGVSQSYAEEKILEIVAPGMKAANDCIEVSCTPSIGTGYAGIHTYNINEEYEVIDLKYRGGRSVICLLKNLKRHYFSKWKERG